MTKVAIIIPTMNRPDFILRQFEFYEQMKSPHPVYISDSSNEENAEKIKSGIKKFKNFEITYQWAPPGKDCTYSLMPLIKEKYCMAVNDDDIMIPKTISECADFLEEHPDYGTCAGKQVNVYFTQEDFNKPYGIIERQTRPFGRSIEDDNMLVRIQDLSSPNKAMPFICFAVTRIEVERDMRNITKNVSLMEDMFEFLVLNLLIMSGKSKMLDKLGYIMQRSIIRFPNHRLREDFLSFPAIIEYWRFYKEGVLQILQKSGISQENSLRTVKWLFAKYLYENLYYSADMAMVNASNKEPVVKTDFTGKRRSKIKKLRHLISHLPFLKAIYYKINPPDYVDRSESRYFNDFKVVKDFLEKNKTP